MGPEILGNIIHEKTDKLTARCNPYIKELLVIISAAENESMADVLAKSVVEYYMYHFPGQAFVEKEQAMFGKYSSGKGDLSEKRKQYRKELVYAKHSNR